MERRGHRPDCGSHSFRARPTPPTAPGRSHCWRREYEESDDHKRGMLDGTACQLAGSGVVWETRVTDTHDSCLKEHVTGDVD